MDPISRRTLLACLAGVPTHAFAGEPVSFDPIARGLAAKALPQTYLGPVATRCAYCGQQASQFKQAMSETQHWLRDDVSSVILVFANFLATGGIEMAHGAPTTITASVIGPTGILTPATFAGRPQGTIPDIGLLFSDPVPLSGKRGQPIRVRNYQVNPTSILYNGQHAGPNDAMAYGTSGIADQTLGGAITNGSGSNAHFPVAILGQTSRPTFFIGGDSIEFGYTDNLSDAYGDVGILARALGRNYAYIHGGIPSATLAGAINQPSTFANRLVLAPLCSHVVDELGINDVGTSVNTTAAAMAALRTNFAAKFPGKTVLGTTLTPHTTSTDGWTTLANQTVTAAEALRTSFNALVRAGIAGESGYIDLADAVESDRDSGKWSVGYASATASGIANTNDGLHPNPTGNVRPIRTGVVPAYFE